MQERSFVIPEDVQEMAHPVLRHRLILKPEAEIDGLTVDRLLDSVIAVVPVPRRENKGALVAHPSPGRGGGARRCRPCSAARCGRRWRGPAYCGGWCCWPCSTWRGWRCCPCPACEVARGSNR